MKVQQAKLKLSFSQQINEQKQHLMNSMKLIENETQKIGGDMVEIIYELKKQGFNMLNIQKRNNVLGIR